MQPTCVQQQAQELLATCTAPGMGEEDVEAVLGTNGRFGGLSAALGLFKLAVWEVTSMILSKD